MKTPRLAVPANTRQTQTSGDGRPDREELLNNIAFYFFIGVLVIGILIFAILPFLG